MGGVLVDGCVYRAEGYWVSPEGLALLTEDGAGCERKVEVLRKVEVQQGMRPLDVVLVAAGALVVGVSGGIVVGVVVGQ